MQVQIDSIGDAIVREDILRDSLQKVTRERDALAKKIGSAKAEQQKLIPKGNEERAKLLASLETACTVEARRGPEYSGPADAAAYYAVVFDEVNVRDNALNGFADDGRFVGVYTIAGKKSWTSPPENRDFREVEGNALSLLLGDLLADCMEKGSKDEGSFNRAYASLRPYLG